MSDLHQNQGISETKDVNLMFYSQNAALSCGMHALVHTLIMSEQPEQALSHYDQLAGMWLSGEQDGITDAEREQFRYHSDQVRRQIECAVKRSQLRAQRIAG